MLTGRGRFVDDIAIAGTLHVAFRRSDHAHARILNVDSNAASACPGVVAIYTARDIEADFRPIIAHSRMRNYQPTALQVLAKEKVRFAGEAIAAVVAENRYLAEDAAALIEVEYEALESLVDPLRSLSAEAPRLHEGTSSNVLVERTFARGDIERAFHNPPVVVKERFRFRRKAPAALESRCYLANYRGAEDLLTLHTSTQVPGIVRDALVDALGIPGSRLRVVAPDVGGGFGGKTSLYPEEVLVCVLSRKLERPVKWTSDRLEDLTTTSHGFDEVVEAELALDEEGNFLGLRADVIGDVGAYSLFPFTAAIEPVQVASFLPGPYKIDTYQGRVRCVATSKTALGPYRGVGRPAAAFVMERLVDMAAKRLGLDPKAMRLQNLVQPEDFPYKVASGLVWDRSGFTEGVIGACDAISYDALRRQQEQARRDGRLVGIGMATYAELTGIGSRLSASPGMPFNTGTETAHISLDSTGGITAKFGVTSFGQGLETALSQVVADELGVAIEDVAIVQGDTAAVAHSTGSYASRGAVMGAGCGMLAAAALKARLFKVAGLMLNAPPGEVTLEQAAFSAPHTERRISFRELARTYYSQQGAIATDVKNELGELSASRMYDPEWGTTSSGTHIALVEVDRETCKVKVLKYVVAEDCGQLINPRIVAGQNHGGVAQGIGAALLEEVVFDEQGQNLTASFMDYVLPSAVEVPRMEQVHLDLEKPQTLGGVRGMGEGGTIGAPAAIANAVALAPFDCEVTELPITPERMFRLMQGKRKGSGRRD
ncbi:MAG: xanthine dehydrogenase family protein molybdopterin-binding subunit [Gammaproteobacteria bacterium]|nr:xanthine dehydrogenase family protein molybdopterin-binding subunit [Gammaproteobacteria bacterium]